MNGGLRRDRDETPPAVAAGRPRTLVRSATARQADVRAVLASCDRDSAVGRRSYAILLRLARLAVRGGEVARPELADIDRRAVS